MVDNRQYIYITVYAKYLNEIHCILYETNMTCLSTQILSVRFDFLETKV